MRRGMILDLAAVCRHHGIKMSSPEHKHTRDGWLHVCCPFCKDDNYHLGFSVSMGFFNCYHCGRLGVKETIARLLKVNIEDVWSYIKDFYVRSSGFSVISSVQRDKRSDVVSEIKFPPLCGPMSAIHKKYLRNRGFDPDRLEADWDLRGTGPISDKGWKFRLIIPVKLDGQIVSYQGRDVTGMSEVRYRSCSDEVSIVPIKNCLYGIDEVRGSSVLIVEGVPSVWRLGRGAVATFGTKVTKAQQKMLMGFQRRYICFDRDPVHDAGRLAAEKLASDLSVFSGDTCVVSLPDGVKDPGDLRDDEAAMLMESCGFKT